MKPAENIEKIRTRNDALRRDLPNPAHGDLFFTAGVVALCNEDRFELLEEIRCFEDFDADDNRHDFGKVDFRGARYFWKIDAGKILTIMLADEY